MTDRDQSATDDEQARRELGNRLRLRRDEVGMNQTDIGALAGISRTTMRAVETGKPVEPRTLANVKRALGCAPSTNYSSRHGPEVLRPVLSPRATALLASGVLRGGEQGRTGMISDYFDLVNALSERPPDLPATLHRFWDTLEFLVPKTDLQLVDREIRDFVTAATTAGIDEAPARPLISLPLSSGAADIQESMHLVRDAVATQEAHWQALERAGVKPGKIHPIVRRHVRKNLTVNEAFLIARSGLSEMEQDGLAQFVSSQRDQFDARMESTLVAVIDQLKGSG